jgi:hypothetical protein
MHHDLQYNYRLLKMETAFNALIKKSVNSVKSRFKWC